MRVYRRLLGYLGPYRLTLASALACMVVYAATSAISLGLIAPFMKVLFEGGRAPAATVTAPAPTAAGRPGAGAVTGTPGGSEAIPPGAVPGAPGAAPAGPRAAPARLTGWPQPLRGWLERAFLDARPLVALERVCIFILIVLFIKNASDYLQAYLMVSVEQGAIRDLRSHVYGHLLDLPLAYHHGRRGGALVSRVTNDVEYLRASLASGIGNLVKDGLTLIGCLMWVVIASWRLALLSAIVLPPAALALVVIGRKMRKRSNTAQERMGDLTSILQETLAGARVVKAFGMEPAERARFDAMNQRYYNAFVHLRRVSAAARPVSEYAVVVVAVAMMWFGGREIFVHHTLEPQQFVLFVTALLSTISPIKTLSEVHTNVQQGIAAANRVFAVIDAPPVIVDRPDAPPLPPFRDAIRYEHVSFAYQPDVPVLEDVSFEVRRGEVVALVGPSGAGKSTAMDLLGRFHDPTGGRVTIDGHDLRDVTLTSLRAGLGVVTQDTILFHDTVRHNIAYGTPGATEPDIEAAAEAANALEFIRRMPEGFDSVIGDRGVRLSGGERQRLAIARALLRNPPVLLLDEATSSLDMESERLVQGALERLMRNRTVLVIAHRLSTVQSADRIVVLERGRVAAAGTHPQLLGQDGLYRRLYDLQFVA